MQEEQTPQNYVVDEVDYLELASRAIITKQDHPDRDDAWLFDFSKLLITTTDAEGTESHSPLPVSLMGEHADTEEEAVTKVAARMAEGARSGDYSAPESRAAIAAEQAAAAKAEA